MVLLINIYSDSQNYKKFENFLFICLKTLLSVAILFIVNELLLYTSYLLPDIYQINLSFEKFDIYLLVY